MNIKPRLCALAHRVHPVGLRDAPSRRAPARLRHPATAGILKSGVYLQNFDKSVRPQDDFYRYVNGQWLATTTIPADRSNYGAFSLLEEGAERDLHAILEEAAGAGAPQGTDTQKIGDFYASFMDEATIESRGLQPLAARVRAASTRSSPKQDVARHIGRGQRIFVSHPFVLFVAIDEKNSDQYVGKLYQTGLGMPDRDYYLSDDERLKQRAREVSRVRSRICSPRRARRTQQRRRNRSSRSKPSSPRRTGRACRIATRRRPTTATTGAALRKLMPSFDWDAFFAGAQIAGVEGAGAWSSRSRATSRRSTRSSRQRRSRDWRSYFRYKLLNTYAPDLPQKFVQLHFDFNERTVSGIEELKPRWKRGVDTVENAVGDLAGKVYVERHFSQDAKQRMDAARRQPQDGVLGAASIRSSG